MKTLTIALLFVVLSFVLGIGFYNSMPDRIISHWNAKGIADGYSSKFIGLFLVPVISGLMLILFLILPKIDPMKKNYLKFRKYYDAFILILILFLFYINVITIAANLGFKFNMNYFIIPAMGLLFFYSGIILEKSKRNWFIGIRTPWTLSSDEIWNKTHKIGGKLFKLAGVISIFGIFFGSYGYFFVLVPILLFSMYLILYSYLKFRELKQIKNKKK
jgi:uncharacterized membrane protein